VYITKISAFLPGEPISNDEIEDVLGYIGGKPSKAKKIVLRNNGIKNRHYAINKTTKKIDYSNTKLTANAVKGVIDGKNIDILACGTSTPDQLLPGHALMVQGELSLPPLEAISVSGICLSGTMSLKYAYAAIKADLAKNAVATGSELVSPMLSHKNFESESEHKVSELEKRPEIAFEKDFLRWMLSDGAGAMLLENTPNADGLSLKIEWIETKSYAGEMPVCMYCGGMPDEKGGLKGWKEFDSIKDIGDNSLLAIAQDVKLLNEKIILYTVEKPLADIVKDKNTKASEIDWFLPHYSSEYFMDRVFEGMQKIGFEIPKEKWFTNLSYKGNTGSASMYIILEELFNSGKLKKGEKILCFIPESGRFSTGFMLLEVV
jgi:3-oxoacyl-[acyl-carrier-protein] synthase III